MMITFCRIAVLAIIFNLSDESKIKCPSPPFKLFVYKKDGNSLKNIADQCNARCLSSKGFLASQPSLKNPICFNKIVKLKKLFVPQNHEKKYPCQCHYLNKYGEKSRVCHQPLSQNKFMTSEQCDVHCEKMVALFYSEVGENMNLVACRNLDELVALSTLTGCVQMKQNEVICHCCVPAPTEDSHIFLNDDSLAPFIKSYDSAELGYFDPSANDFRLPSEIDKNAFANRTDSVSYRKGEIKKSDSRSAGSDSVQFLRCENKKLSSVEEKRSPTEKRTSLSKSSPQSIGERAKKLKIRRTISPSPQRSTNSHKLSGSPTNINANQTPKRMQIVESQIKYDKKSRDTLSHLTKGKEISSSVSVRDIPSDNQGVRNSLSPCKSVHEEVRKFHEFMKSDERLTNLSNSTANLNVVPVTNKKMCKNNVTAISSDSSSDDALNSGEDSIKEATDSDIYSIETQKESTTSKSEHKNASQTSSESKSQSPSTKFTNGKAGKLHLQGTEITLPINNSGAPQSSGFVVEMNQPLRTIRNACNERKLIIVPEKVKENEVSQSPRIGKEVVSDLKLGGKINTRKNQNSRKCEKFAKSAKMDAGQTSQPNTIINSKLMESRNYKKRGDTSRLRDMKARRKTEANGLKTERTAISNVKLKFENCQLIPTSISGDKTSEGSNLHFYIDSRPDVDINARVSQNDPSISINEANLNVCYEVGASKRTTAKSNDSHQKTKTKLLDELEFDSKQNESSSTENQLMRLSLRNKNALKTPQKKGRRYGDKISEAPITKKISSHLESKSETNHQKDLSKLKN